MSDHRLRRLVVTGVALAAIAGLGLIPLGPSPPGQRSSGFPPGIGPLEIPVGTPFNHWTSYHGSENRSGFTPFSGPSTQLLEFYACVTPAHLRLGPVLDDRRVYVADDLGNVLAINRTGNGSLVWSLDLGGEPVQLDLSGSSLHVGTVLGGLFDLATSNGSVNWRLVLTAGIVQGIADGGGEVLVGTTNGNLQAFNAATGSELWSTHLGERIAGAPAVENGVAYVATVDGHVDAVTLGGTILWTTRVPHEVRTAVAVSFGRVIVADAYGNVTAFFAANGTHDWTFSSREIGYNESFGATPAVGLGMVVAEGDTGGVYALNVTNGTLRWVTSGIYSGLPVVAAPVLTPTGIYLVENGIEAVQMIGLGNGSLIWQQFPASFSFSPPAVDGGHLYLGLDDGCLASYGPRGGPAYWPVSGTVVDVHGTPIRSAYVSAARSSNFTEGNGSFTLLLANGSYAVQVYANGFGIESVPVTVDGPVTGLAVVLRPLTVYPVLGWVIDSASGRGVSQVPVSLTGTDGYNSTAVTDARGAFRLSSPNGSATIVAAAARGHEAGSTTIFVDGGAALDVQVAAYPTALELGSTDPHDLRVLAPLAVLAAAAVGFGAWEVHRRRVEAGLAPGLLSPFGRFVAMRVLLIPFQVLLVLAVLYSIGTILPSAAAGGSPCALAAGACTACHWSVGDWPCASHAALTGFGTFAYDLFTGNWGWAGIGNLREPVPQFLAWWGTDSLELALVSLAIAVGIGYPLALATGWRRGSAVDPIARVTSLLGLLLPSVLVALALAFLVSQWFLARFGDLPFGTLPSLGWFTTHGGTPSWIGVGGNTLPTGFPIVDGLVHRDWTFTAIVATKTVLQAAAIAIIYLAVFFRHAWSVASDAARAPHVVAARARGVPERTILWRHTHRRTLPVVVLVFGLTLPAFIGTQALVESMFSDSGFGTLLLIEVANLRGEPPGFTGPTTGNFYQVLVFLLALLLLVSTLCADILARYLDPRLTGGER